MSFVSINNFIENHNNYKSNESADDFKNRNTLENKPKDFNLKRIIDSSTENEPQKKLAKIVNENLNISFGFKDENNNLNDHIHIPPYLYPYLQCKIKCINSEKNIKTNFYIPVIILQKIFKNPPSILPLIDHIPSNRQIKLNWPVEDKDQLEAIGQMLAYALASYYEFDACLGYVPIKDQTLQKVHKFLEPLLRMVYAHEIKDLEAVCKEFIVQQVNLDLSYLKTSFNLFFDKDLKPIEELWRRLAFAKDSDKIIEILLEIIKSKEEIKEGPLLKSNANDFAQLICYHLKTLDDAGKNLSKNLIPLSFIQKICVEWIKIAPYIAEDFDFGILNSLAKLLSTNEALLVQTHYIFYLSHRHIVEFKPLERIKHFDHYFYWLLKGKYALKKGEPSADFYKRASQLNLNVKDSWAYDANLCQKPLTGPSSLLSFSSFKPINLKSAKERDLKEGHNEKQLKAAMKIQEVKNKQTFYFHDKENALNQYIDLSDLDPYKECKIKCLDLETGEKISYSVPWDVIANNFAIYKNMAKAFKENQTGIIELQLEDKNEQDALEQALTFALARTYAFNPSLNYITLKNHSPDFVNGFLSQLLKSIDRCEIGDLEKECAEFIGKQIIKDPQHLQTYFACAFDSDTILQQTWIQAATESINGPEVIEVLFELLQMKEVEGISINLKIIECFIEIISTHLCNIEEEVSEEWREIFLEQWISLAGYLNKDSNALNTRESISKLSKNLDTSEAYLVQLDYLLDKINNLEMAEEESAITEMKRLLNALENCKHYFYLLLKANHALVFDSLPKALEMCTQAIKLEENTLTYELRGRIYLELSQYEEASSDFKQAIKHDEANFAAKDLLEEAIKRI